VPGDRHISGNGVTNFEGDNHGTIQHRFGEPDRPADDSR
jgi:hypothetical protein